MDHAVGELTRQKEAREKTVRKRVEKGRSEGVKEEKNK